MHQFKNCDQFKYIAEVRDVVGGNAVGRENDKERILVYNIGVSMHDINFATRIYKSVKNDNSLIDLDMCEPTDIFWI